MKKLIKRLSYQQKLRLGGQIRKCQLGDVFEKGISYIFNGQDGSFSEAFSNARKQNQKYFRWDGKLYNTNVETTPSKKVTSKKVTVNPKKKVIKKEPASQLDIYHKFNTRNFDEFINIMYPIFEASFNKYNLPITQIQNVMRQSAFESGYGTNPRGSKGYNLGGIKWEKNPRSNTYKYNHTTYSGDGTDYVDFNNLQDYADYKIQLLNNTYNALNATDTNDFVNRLHGQNPYKKSYSDSVDNYRSTLTNMKSFDRAYNRYMAKRKKLVNK